MKNNKMTREEKRRLLFNKKYEYNENTFAIPNGATEGAKAWTKKHIHQIISIVVAIAVLTSSVLVGVSLLTKAANAKTYFTELSQTDPQANTRLTKTYEPGNVYYYYQPEDKTYTYNLTTQLVPGDTVTFDTDTKNITWSHHAADTVPEGSVNITVLMDLDEEASQNGTYVFNLKNNAALNPGTNYYYDAGAKTYQFQVPEFVGYQKTDASNTSNRNSRDYFMKDPLKNGVNVILTLDTSDLNNLTGVLSGDQLTRHTIYVRTEDLHNNGVYVITKETSNGEGIIHYTETGSQSLSIRDDDCDNYKNSNYHKTYDITTPSISVVAAGDDLFYNVDGTAATDAGGETIAGNQYIDSLNQPAETYVGTNVPILTEFQAQSVGSPSGFYLAGYDSSNDAGARGQYTTKKVLGSIFRDNANVRDKVYVHDLCTDTNWSWGTTYHHNYGAIWNYSDNSLTNTNYELNSNIYLGSLSGTAYALTRATSKSTAGNTYLYELNNVYEKTPVSETPFSATESGDSSGLLEVTEVSYSNNSAIAGNNLEIDKTITAVDKNEGIYDIKLEAYTTSNKLNQPATDIMLVLDTSKNMMNSLYSRDFTNLNTFEGFKEIDLAKDEITHDMLFDREVNSGWGGAALEVISRIFAGSRDYIHNKYVEDPAAPGTYVYLHQWYNLRNLITNQYRYYFTSSDGTTYQTQVFTQNVLGTGLDAAPLPTSGLVFTATGKPTVTREKIYTLTNYQGKNADNGSAARNENLYNVAQSSGHLYIKDNDGNFRRVFMFKDRRGDGSHDGVYQAGMYRYAIFEGDTTSGALQYEFSTGNTETLNNGTTPAANFGIFQGFRKYDAAHNLQGDYILSKTLYTKTAQDVTALQAMKESLESFLLNAHEQVAAKGAEAYVGLVAYDKGSAVMYGLKPGSGNDYTDLSLTVGDNSVDNMISTIYNYVVEEYEDTQTHKYNVIPANVAHVDDWINRFKGTYAAEVDSGMTDAKNQIQNYNHNKQDSTTGETIKSRRYTVLFTAGVPAAYTSNIFGADTSGEFTTKTADGAISAANTLKNSLDTTVYSVGLFDNAKPGKIHGQYWYYRFTEKVPCSGRVGSMWGGSWASTYRFSMDPKDAYATNRMLEYISSDYTSTTELGLTRGKYSPSYSGLISNFITRGTGYRVDRNFTKTDTGFYMAISPKNFDEDAATEEASGTSLSSEEVEAILNDVFQALNIATAAPKNALDADSFLVDGITSYFDLVESTPVKAEVMDANGNVDAMLTAGLTVTPSTADSTTKTISVKGFDYSTHWIGDGNTNPQRKVVLTFRVKRTAGEIGGNNIPTNLSKTAIYDGDARSITAETPYGIMEERFEIPKVDLPIQMTNFTKDASIFYGNTQDLAGLIDIQDLEEIELAGNNGTLIPNEFVNIYYEVKAGNNTVNTYMIPAGSTIGKWSNPVQTETDDDTPGTINEGNLSSIYAQPQQSTEYTVNVRVEPIYSGTVPNKNYNDNSAKIYVFDPHYTTYNGTVDNLGDEYDLTYNGKTPALTEWKYDNAIELTESEITEAKALLDKDKIPTVTYDLNLYENNTQGANKGTNKNTFKNANNTVTQETESTSGNLDHYVVNNRHDLIMNNVQVKADPVEYKLIQQVAKDYYDSEGLLYMTINMNDAGEDTDTVYYDANGQVMEGATTGRELAEGVTVSDTPEAIYGEVFKYYSPITNASTNNKVTYNNATDNRSVGASFTLNLKSHDVTITNHTVKSEDAEADYADRTRAFPLTITLKDGDDPVVGETIHYTDPSGNSQTATTDSNGQFVINLKHEETATLAEIRDGYTLTVTSDPSDAYHVGYRYAEGEGSLGPAQNVDIQTESATFTVSDDLTIDVTHSIDDIPITGYPDKNALFNPFFILAAMLTLGGGAWGGYTYKRKKEQELAAYLANRNK